MFVGSPLIFTSETSTVVALALALVMLVAINRVASIISIRLNFLFKKVDIN